MADVTLTDIRKSFGPVEVLHGASLAIAEGEFVSPLGASGCGKTPLLRTVSRPEAPTSGRVCIGRPQATRLPPAPRHHATARRRQSESSPHLRRPQRDSRRVAASLSSAGARDP